MKGLLAFWVCHLVMVSLAITSFCPPMWLRNGYAREALRYSQTRKVRNAAPGWSGNNVICFFLATVVRPQEDI